MIVPTRMRKSFMWHVKFVRDKEGKEDFHWTIVSNIMREHSAIAIFVNNFLDFINIMNKHHNILIYIKCLISKDYSVNTYCFLLSMTTFSKIQIGMIECHYRI